ncbi:MAG TPA: helix-turn-helix domain-containing protein [Patescibacteria group bacterium]|nr:helix-turn-helix domain-containing protein [Patescibacteria group bacterium]
MDFSVQLKQVGLQGNEIKIYLYLLGQGVSTPPQIAKGTGITRTNCYHLLRNLKEKGLLSEQMVQKRKSYLAKDPESLLFLLEQRKSALASLLPDLRALFTTQKNKPKIEFYEGMGQIKEIYLQTLSAKEVFGIGSTKQLSEWDPPFFAFYLRQLKQKGIVFHDILSFQSKQQGMPEMKEILKGFYEAKFFPASFRDQPVDLLIWNDRFALLTLQEPFFGTVLTNPLIAEMFRMVFRVLWERLD